MVYDGQVIANSVAYAAIGNWFIKKVKESSLVPFINKESYWVNKTFAMLVAFVSAMGVTYTYSYSADGILNLQLSGLTVLGIWASLKTFIISYALQQTGYHITKSEVTVGAVTNPIEVKPEVEVLEKDKP